MRSLAPWPVIGCVVVSLFAAPSCTRDSASSTPTATASCGSNDPICEESLVEVEGTVYRVECAPVPRALVDVMLTGEGGRPVRAIAGVSSSQAVAVLWRDPSGCGEFALALADGLSAPAATLIREEMARAVKRFGVTLSPTPAVDS